ncbi:MAG: hypothetical protein R3C10_22385 [Pirellulales bacterium]
MTPPDVRAFVGDSYPHNHTYFVGDRKLKPHRQLATRVARLSECYPSPLESLLDLSCSKGFFVFDAVSRLGCRRALGVDLDLQCLHACQSMRQRFTGASHIQFVRLNLREMAERIDDFGGPFQTVLLINSYQYFVLGSDIAPGISLDHAEIFHLLRRVCSGRLIFENRIQLQHLQRNLKERAARLGSRFAYNPHVIIDAAGRYFNVQPLASWSRYPTIVMDAI